MELLTIHAPRPVPPWRGPHTACGLPAGARVLLAPGEFTARQREDGARSRFGRRGTCPRCRLKPWESRLRWEDDSAEVLGLDFAVPRWEPWRMILRPSCAPSLRSPRGTGRSSAICSNASA